MFATVTRMKLTFQMNNGSVFVQDLWEYPLKDLNVLAISLRTLLKQQGEDDFLRSKTKEDKLTKLKFDVVKYIIDTLLDEQEASIDLAAKSQEKQVLLKALARKQEQSIDALSEEEVLAKLAELDS